MVAKKMIIRLMEEFLGEYIINISKENLKVAVLRGKIKLENVQLDGDLIGSHVLSAVGLSGFAVLSCTAEKLRANIPWSKLEKEPTTFELVGLQLICVPLLPSNSMRVFGAGTRLDPRCTLRTRVKRSALARFERNFFSWRIPGEGPKRPKQQKRKRGKRRHGHGGDGTGSVFNGGDSVQSSIWDDQSTVGPGTIFSMEGQDQDENMSVMMNGKEKEMSDAQRNAWMEKLRTKLFRNIEISVKDIHIRCEVCEGALDVDQHRGGIGRASTPKSTSSFMPQSSPDDSSADSDRSPFAFGVNVDSIMYKSANSLWQSGKNIDWKRDEQEKQVKDGEKGYKILDVSNLALYWDDEPPLLLSECPIFKFSGHQFSEHKVIRIVRKAMERMKTYQEPGDAVRQTLDCKESASSVHSKRSLREADLDREHVYLLQKSNMEVRLLFTIFEDGSGRPNICSAELIPCSLDLSFSPKQLRQRRLLEYTMIAQRRLDTMLHQRPKRRPTKDPRAWWRYVISCVMTCPNSRPWRDVKTIVAKRSEYVALVEKKHLKRGLDEIESAVLLHLEDVLPMETLLAFHLIALRNVVEKREARLLEKKSPKRRSKSRQQRRSYKNESDSVDVQSVLSTRSRVFSLSLSPKGRKRRSRSRNRQDDESLTNITLYDDPHKHPALPPTRSPLPKIPAVTRIGPYSPLKDRHNARIMDDDMSQDMSIMSKGTMNLENSSTAGTHTFDLGAMYDDDGEVLEEHPPPMIRMVRCHSLTVTATLMDRHNGNSVFLGSLQASLWAKHSFMQGASFLFDIKRIDCIDCIDDQGSKIFTFDAPTPVSAESKLEFGVGEADDETSDVTMPNELPNSFSEDRFIDQFCSQMLDEDMPLPPRGIVCRLLIAITSTGRSVSLSAHAATLVWNTRCIRAFMDSFFPTKMQEDRSILRTQLRNAATPLAHKAAVALTSPRSMSIKVNIVAPKVWVPVSQSASDGALLVDCGRLNMALSKPQSVANMHWSIHSSGMYVNFRQRKSTDEMFSGFKEVQMPYLKDDISILSPFNFDIELDRSGEGPAFLKMKEDGAKYEQSRRVSINSSKISVNLVDVEVLALAIGRWYAAEMLLLKRRKEQNKKMHRILAKSNNAAEVDNKVTEEEITLSIESVELFLQGQTNSKESNGRKRTYMVQVANIEAKRCKLGEEEKSNIDIGSAQIIQGSNSRAVQRQFEPSDELQHKFLTCLAQRKGSQTKLSNSSGGGALQVTILRDKEKLSNDFDVSFGCMVLRLTPTALTDSAIAISRILESTKTITEEMERRVHAASRSARITESLDGSVNIDGIPSNMTSSVTSVTLNTLNTMKRREIPDSMFVVKVAIKEAAILIGSDFGLLNKDDDKRETDAYRSVVQITFSILLMFQSTENWDASGKKVLHASFDNFWASLTKGFTLLPIRKCKPLLVPFAFEFRVVSGTTNFGEIISRDYNVDSDSIQISVCKHNVGYLMDMFSGFARILGEMSKLASRGGNPKLPSSKSDSVSIVTTMSFQFQPCSITVLSQIGQGGAIIPLLNMRGESSGKVDGATNALSGEFKIDASLYFFSRNIQEMVHLMERFSVLVELDYQPKDMMFKAFVDKDISFNITSEMLERWSEEISHSDLYQNKSRLQPVKNVVKIINESGIDFLISPMSPHNETSDVHDVESMDEEVSRSKSLRDGSHEFMYDEGERSQVGLLSVPTPEQGGLVCECEPLLDLPLHPIRSPEMFRLFPKTKNGTYDSAGLNMEPVVEYCMQNQRLRSAFSDPSTLENGTDLLSSQFWSPSDQIFTRGHGNHWLHPYLNDDVPEWSDKTFTLRLDKDRSMLPDNNWMWLTEWEVDVSGTFGKETDADGWDYAEDFKRFGSKRRFYQDGDTCRRRMWTRTRIMKKELNERVERPIPLLWTSAEKEGCKQITITSHIRIINTTDKALTIFAHKYPWEDDRLLGSVAAGEEYAVPVQRSSITHMRLGIQDETLTKPHQGIPMSKRLFILPTSRSYRKVLRAEIYLDATNTTEELLSARSLHFLISMNHSNGLIHMTIEPVLKVVNLLPCVFHYRLMEAARQLDDMQKEEAMIETEENEIAIGDETCCLTVDPSLNPSIAFRLPGYQWSPYQRIVNRPSAESSWRANRYDERLKCKLSQNGDERGCYTTLIELQSIAHDGDPLTIILEVSPGHSPTLRVYAQYWIADMSGFGLRFCDGANDLLGTSLVSSKVRRSYSKKGRKLQSDGYQWAVGKDGMSLYFSEKNKIAVSVDLYRGDMSGKPERTIRTGWSHLLDISNVMPKTMFSVHELNSPGRHDFCYDVTNAPFAGGRTKIVRICSRFHVINLSNSALYLTQEGCPNEITFVQPKGSTPFHWDRSSLPSRIRLSTNCVNWSSGSIQLDKVGITSIKLHDTTESSPVLQMEVRLATKDQNAAVTVLIWNSEDESRSLYTLRNLSSQKILCCQQLQNDEEEKETEENTGEFSIFSAIGCGGPAQIANVTDFVSNGCGFSPEYLWAGDSSQWVLETDDTKCFGFDDPLRAHVLEWTVPGSGLKERLTIEVDTVGSHSIATLRNGRKVGCIVRAENSTKVIEFSDLPSARRYGDLSVLDHMKCRLHENSLFTSFSGETALGGFDSMAISIEIVIPGILLSVVESYHEAEAGREILFASMNRTSLELAQNVDGYHELELKVATMQIDNHIPKAAHPVLISFLHSDNEPVFHLSVVRKRKEKGASPVYRYLAIRLLEIFVALDRRTTEALMDFLEPLDRHTEVKKIDPKRFLHEYTDRISNEHVDVGSPCADCKIGSHRLYIEELQLHPARISITFTQDWDSRNSSPEGPALLQYIRLAPSISNASFIFTSFVVSHAFESPFVLKDIIRVHYMSQVTQHVFSLIGSLAILEGPADFLGNIGTGVRDFFYEPINGLVHGPGQFLEGLETGSLSLVRGVFVGVVRGAANVTGAVNSNIVNLTDNSFIEERNAHQQSVTDLTHRSESIRLSDIFSLAGARVAHGIRSGAKGLYEEPFENFNRQGAAGFAKGVGHALVSAIVKPIVGIGDGAILMMQHVTHATDDQKIAKRKRLRRALPRKLNTKRNTIKLLPYEEKSALAQKMVAGHGNHDDAYIGHIYTERFLLIASEEYFWIIGRRHTNRQEKLQWEEISHFHMFEERFMHIITFTTKGLRPRILEFESCDLLQDLNNLLSIQNSKMTNAMTWSFGNSINDFISNGTEYDLVGMKEKQTKHVFGSINCQDYPSEELIEDEIQIIEQCYERVRYLCSDKPTFFSSLDDEAWSLINTWRHMFFGMNSKHCLAAGFINGLEHDIQIKSTTLLEGGSPCCHIPSRDYDELNCLLKPGGAIIFFAWGVPPSLNQDGAIYLQIETNAFTCTLVDRKSPLTRAETLLGCQCKCIFLEKSISDWWAKYWVLIK